MPDIPFELILFILFFVLPALSSVLRRRGGQGGQPGRDAPRPERRPSQTDTAAPTAAPNDGPSPAPDWLEEARRRVAEARQREAEGRQPGTPPASPAQRPSRPVTPPRTLRERSEPRPQRSLEGQSLEGRTVRQRGAGRKLERESLEGRSAEQTSAERTSAERTSVEGASLETLTPGLADRSETPPLRVQRLTSPKRATITKQELRFDAHDLAKGLIWHQVLSPPRSTLRRTRLSRRRP